MEQRHGNPKDSKKAVCLVFFYGGDSLGGRRQLLCDSRGGQVELSEQYFCWNSGNIFDLAIETPSCTNFCLVLGVELDFRRSYQFLKTPTTRKLTGFIDVTFGPTIIERIYVVREDIANF